MPKIKAVIFDFDGVLVESAGIKTQAFTELFSPQGREVAGRVRLYHLKHAGVSRFEKFKYIYKNILKRRLSDRVFKQLCLKFSLLVLDKVVHAPYVKGAEEFLKEYHRRYKLFVVSATPEGEIKKIIKRRNMPGYFFGIFGSPKNKSAIVKEIIEKNNLKPSEVVYIGDALSDYRAAKDNRIAFIGRVSGRDKVFNGIKCTKIRNLTGINMLLGRYN